MTFTFFSFPLFFSPFFCVLFFSQGMLRLTAIFANRIAFSSAKTRAQNGRGVPT